MGIILVVLLVYIFRLFQLQVLDSSYRRSADKNALRQITEHPARGLIYDKNDSLLVYNDAAYDLMVVPNELRAFDTTELCNLLEITKEELMKRIEKACKWSVMIPSLISQQMSKEDYGYLQEKLHKFPGFFVQNRTLRHYPHPNSGSYSGVCW